MALQLPIEINTMINLTIPATTSTQSISSKETTIRFSDYTMTLKTLHRIVLAMSFLQQRYNLQSIVSDWAKQSTN